MTEQFKLGVQPPIRQSGDLAGTPGLTLEGPAGSTVIERGVICAQRHIHMTPEDAMRFHVRDNTVVRVRIEGERQLIFGDVVVRVNPAFRPIVDPGPRPSGLRSIVVMDGCSSSPRRRNRAAQQADR